MANAADASKKRSRAKRAGARPREVTAQLPPVRSLKARVIWGDIKFVPQGDVVVAGHYIDVTPQAAEAALDEMVSDERLKDQRLPDKLSDVERQRFEAAALERRAKRVIHSLTLRGAIRGSLGDIYLYPMAEWHQRELDSRLSPSEREARASRLVAIAGMGHMGTFGVYELRRLSQGVASTVSLLPDRRHVCAVLIGSGIGNLNVELAARSAVSGFLDGVRDGARHGQMTLSIVERNLGRAFRIHAALRDLAAEEAAIEVHDAAPEMMADGHVGREDMLILALASAAESARMTDPSSEEWKALATVLEHARSAFTSRSDLLERITMGLRGLREDQQRPVLDVLTNIEVSFRADSAQLRAAPTRLTCLRELDQTGQGILAFAALSATTVIPKRLNPIDWGLIEDVIVNVRELGDRKAPPPVREMDRYPPLLRGLLVPRDFWPYLGSSEAGQSLDAPLIFEVDRQTASVHWEVIGLAERGEQDPRPVSLERSVSRQLRTEYSPRPSAARAPDRNLNVLIVADPGDPDIGDSLEGAREEAKAVLDLLSRQDEVTVEILVGAANAKRTGWMTDRQSATRLSVLERLMSGSYDILHYCGHGDFDEDNHSKGGWYFADGFLTSDELASVEALPQLIFANACISARLSTQRAGEKGSRKRRDLMLRDANLAPTLADEFFKRGIRTYIGTAWTIDDAAAVAFAKSFYQTLLFQSQGNKRLALRKALSECVGDAVLAARRELYKKRRSFGMMWAAYQHYGDPTQRLVLPGAVGLDS